MIKNIIALGMERPEPDRYLDSKLIKELDDIKPTNGCVGNDHQIVFAKYEINERSSFFDIKPGICSCGIYWKKLANDEDSNLKEHYIITGKIPPDK